MYNHREFLARHIGALPGGPPSGFQAVDGFAEKAEPALIDGMEPERCRARWLVNRAALEDPSWPKGPIWDLTPAQIEAGKRYRTVQETAAEAFQASLLRVLIKTSDAERKAREPRVLVDLEDE